jgi:hypothetical protein
MDFIASLEPILWSKFARTREGYELAAFERRETNGTLTHHRDDRYTVINTIYQVFLFIYLDSHFNGHRFS